MIPLAIQAALPVLFGVLTLFCTESPLWELQKDRVERARASLAVLRRGSAEAVNAELAVARAAIAESAERQKQTKFFDILRPEHLKRTLTAGAMLCLSQVGGQILVLAVCIRLLSPRALC
jgi:MFS transporter, SP family, sugar:H+ symporter